MTSDCPLHSSSRQFLFVVTFTTFLLCCVEYDVLFANRPVNHTHPGGGLAPDRSKVTLPDAILPTVQCSQRWACVAFWIFTTPVLPSRVSLGGKTGALVAVSVEQRTEFGVCEPASRVVSSGCSTPSSLSLIASLPDQGWVGREFIIPEGFNEPLRIGWRAGGSSHLQQKRFSFKTFLRPGVWLQQGCQLSGANAGFSSKLSFELQSMWSRSKMTAQLCVWGGVRHGRTQPRSVPLCPRLPVLC